MEKFAIIGDIHDDGYGKKKSVSEKITFLQSKAELFVQGSTMLSMLQFQKLVDKNGKEVKGAGEGREPQRTQMELHRNQSWSRSHVATTEPHQQILPSVFISVHLWLLAVDL